MKSIVQCQFSLSRSFSHIHHTCCRQHRICDHEHYGENIRAASDGECRRAREQLASCDHRDKVDISQREYAHVDERIWQKHEQYHNEQHRRYLFNDVRRDGCQERQHHVRGESQRYRQRDVTPTVIELHGFLHRHHHMSKNRSVVAMPTAINTAVTADDMSSAEEYLREERVASSLLCCAEYSGEIALRCPDRVVGSVYARENYHNSGEQEYVFLSDSF